MAERQIPPIFEDEVSRAVFRFRPAPPIEFPFSADEIEIFPRHFTPMMVEKYKRDIKRRCRYYRAQLSQIGRNARRPGRGEHVFIIVPNTADQLIQAIARGPGLQQAETARVISEMYYLGRTADEAESQVSTRTLTRQLQRAERILDVHRDTRNNPFKISLINIRLSYTVLRYGRDAIFDVQTYFQGRIF